MRGIRFRLVPFSVTLVARRASIGMLLLAIVASPAALDLFAKDKERRRAKAAREQQQQQEEAAKVQAANDQPAKDQAAKGNDVTKGSPPAAATANEPAAVTDKDDAAKAKETGKSGDGDKTQDKATIARKVDDKSRPAAPVKAAKPAISPALEAARSSRDAIRKIPAYTCTFSKQEQLKKGTPVRHTMSLKFRREPFSVYLKYVEPNAGREVIYVEGQNNGKLQVHEASGLTSLLGTLTISPTGNEALKENKYPLTMIGMEKMLERFIADWEESQKHADTKVVYYPLAKLGDVECTMYEVAHPEKREPFKFHKSRVYFDKKTLLPIRAEQYAFPARSGEEPQLVEEYTYSDVKAGAPLSEADFDVKNERYGFK